MTLLSNETERVATLTEQQHEKATARAIVLEKLTEYALSEDGSNPVVVPDTRTLRELLNLTHMRKRLFDGSLWHLDAGDRHSQGRRLVRVSRKGIDGRRLPLQVTVVGLALRPPPETDERPGLLPEY